MNKENLVERVIIYFLARCTGIKGKKKKKVPSNIVQHPKEIELLLLFWLKILSQWFSDFVYSSMVSSSSNAEKKLFFGNFKKEIQCVFLRRMKI